MRTLFIVVSIFAVVNGEFLTFKGKCPNPEPPQFLNLSLSGRYFVLALTLNETTRNDIVCHFNAKSSGKYSAHVRYRNLDTDDDCNTISTTLQEIEYGKYNITHQEDESHQYFIGNIVYVLSNDYVVFLCHDTPERNEFQAEISLIKQDVFSGYNSENQQHVQEILSNYDLDFMYKYIKPVEQNNPCI